MHDDRSDSLSRLFEEVSRREGFLLEELRLNIIEQLLEVMETKKVDRAELSRRIKSSRAYITKLFNTKVNLTLRTIVRMAAALGGKATFQLQDAQEPSTAFEARDQLAARAVDRAVFLARGFRIEKIGSPREGKRQSPETAAKDGPDVSIALAS